MGEKTWGSALPHGTGEASKCLQSGDMDKGRKLGIAHLEACGLAREPAWGQNAAEGVPL